jgi:hypothetical protein
MHITVENSTLNGDFPLSKVTKVIDFLHTDAKSTNFTQGIPDFKCYLKALSVDKVIQS